MRSHGEVRPARWLVVAGEPSGDRLAARVIRAAQDLPWCFEGIAGPDARDAGLTPIEDTPDAAMGLWDVLPGTLHLRALAQRLLQSSHRWDGALLVDQHALTLPLGKRLRARGVPVTLLSAPQVWAWRPARARALDDCADAVACLFDVEPPVLRSLGAQRTASVFVGHPAAEETLTHTPVTPPRLGLFPGSRAREITRLLPTLRAVADGLLRRGLIGDVLTAVVPERAGHPGFVHTPGIHGPTAAQTVLRGSAVALACSGTVTLECALAGVPTVVVYRTDPITAAIARRLLRTPWIALPNILLGRSALPEILQARVTVANVTAAVERALDPSQRVASEAIAAKLRAKLVAPGGFGANVVGVMSASLRGRSALFALTHEARPARSHANQGPAQDG